MMKQIYPVVISEIVLAVSSIVLLLMHPPSRDVEKTDPSLLSQTQFAPPAKQFDAYATAASVRTNFERNGLTTTTLGLDNPAHETISSIGSPLAYLRRLFDLSRGASAIHFSGIELTVDPNGGSRETTIFSRAQQATAPIEGRSAPSRSGRQAPSAVRLLAALGIASDRTVGAGNESDSAAVSVLDSHSGSAPGPHFDSTPAAPGAASMIGRGRYLGRIELRGKSPRYYFLGSQSQRASGQFPGLRTDLKVVTGD